MNTMLSMSCQKQIRQPFVGFRGNVLNTKRFFRRKENAVFIVGPTGTGKSRLAIDLARKFNGEIINCDKIQVHRGLDIATNKVTEEECRGVPHHLLGTVDPNAVFTSDDFRHHASFFLESIVSRDKTPFVAGGSNSFVEALTNDDPNFLCNFECHFIWVHVAFPTLCKFLDERVDKMIKSGLVDEVRSIFDPDNKDYTKGIRRAIGVPELDQYFRCELRNVDVRARAKVLDEAIEKIKENNCTLAYIQSKKVQKLQSRWMKNMHRIDATKVFRQSGEEAEEAWQKLVAEPSFNIVEQLLDVPSSTVDYIQRGTVANGAPAVAAAAR